MHVHSVLVEVLHMYAHICVDRMGRATVSLYDAQGKLIEEKTFNGIKLVEANALVRISIEQLDTNRLCLTIENAKRVEAKLSTLKVSSG